MNYYIFKPEEQQTLIHSFLESSSLAHNQPKQTEEWFKWKFLDNPFGETILACAEIDGKIVGCVAYGLQDFILNNKLIKGAISFETFVHPDFQGQGIFAKLLNVAEIKAKDLNLTLLLNFPNSKSLRGFLNKGWINSNIIEYWIKGRNFHTIFTQIFHIKKKFKPNPSNFKTLKTLDVFSFKSNQFIKPIISLEYLNWRFFSYPNTEYHYVKNEIYDSICRVGKRGKIKEAQILFVNIKNPDLFKLFKLKKAFKKLTNYDIISFPISNTNPLRNKLKSNCFLKVPNRTNVCFKILNEKINQQDVKKISLEAINFHTY